MKEYKEILSMNGMEFLSWLESKFSYEIPSHIETPDDIQYELDCMTVYAGANEYLQTVSSYAKILGRSFKRMGKEYKKDYEDIIDKREAVENKIDSIKLAYQTVNKAVTVAVEQAKNPQIFAK